MFNKLFNSLLALWVSFAIAGPALAQNINGNVIPPGAGGSSGYTQFVNVLSYGAKCDGVTDDSAAFTAAIASGSNIVLPHKVTCIVGNLVWNQNQTRIDCNLSIIQASAGSQWILDFEANYWEMSRCIFNDPNFYNKVATTTTAPVTSGFTIPVVSTAGMANGMPVTILLQNGDYFQSKLDPFTGVASATSIKLIDNIPSTVLFATIAAGGSGCGVGNSLVVQGGAGPPATFRVSTVSGSAVTAVVLSSPGFYSALPNGTGLAVLTQGPRNTACAGVTLNLTMGQVANGAIVEASWGSLIVRNSSYFNMLDNTCNTAFSCAGFYYTGTSTNIATQGVVDNFQCNACAGFGMFVGAGVNLNKFRNVTLYGTVHNSYNGGVVGLYREFQFPTWAGIPSGGNHFDGFDNLNFEVGTLIRGRGVTNDLYSGGHINDTNQLYNTICDGCSEVIGTDLLWNAFTGGGNYGIGWYQGNYKSAGDVTATPAVNNIIAGTFSTFNAADFYFSDWYGDGTGVGAALSMSNGANINYTVSGKSAAIYSARDIISGQTGTAVGGTGTTAYFANGSGQFANAAAAANFIPNAHTVTVTYCHSNIQPPAANSYTCNLQINGATVHSCTIAPSNNFCTVSDHGVNIPSNAFVNFSMDSTAGTSAAVFSATAAGF